MIDDPPPHDPTGIVVSALRTACPSFEPAWADHIAAWAEHPEDRGSYLDVATFAEHIISLLEQAQTSELPAVFDTVERLYGSGDKGVVELLTVGFLEAIQNISSNRFGWSFTRRFRRWLGPTTTIEWDELHKLWGTSDHMSRWQRTRAWLDVPAAEPVRYGCAFCADDQNRWYGHVTQIASDDRRGTILLRCPECAALYETTPVGTRPERRITVAEAADLFPGFLGPQDR